MSVLQLPQRAVFDDESVREDASVRASRQRRSWAERGGTTPLYELPEAIRREIERMESAPIDEASEPDGVIDVEPGELIEVRTDEHELPGATPPSMSELAVAHASGGRAPAASAEPAQPAPQPSLFRQEAMRAYSLGAKASSTLQVVPVSARVLLVTLAAAALAALAIAGFGKIDLTARGRGTMRAVTGVQALAFPIDGVVREVLVQSGEVVKAGSVVARLDSTLLSGSLQEAEERLATLERRSRREEAVAQSTYEREAAVLERRTGLLRARMASQGQSVATLEHEQAQYVDLAAEGFVPDKTRRDHEERLQAERRKLLSAQDESTRLAQQLTMLELNRGAGIAGREQHLRDATSLRDAARRMLAQTELRAPRAGRVESLLVTGGDLVGAQKPIARLVPLEAGRTITAFLPERERAFVHAGAGVRVEFDQLPVGEFGSLAARVVRASSELATRDELAQALGAGAPEGVWFSVSLQLLEEPRTEALLAKLGSGSMVTVRLPVRRRRILSLALDPVRKWLN